MNDLEDAFSDQPLLQDAIRFLESRGFEVSALDNEGIFQIVYEELDRIIEAGESIPDELNPLA
jgi:hypothetical protein